MADDDYDDDDDDDDDDADFDDDTMLGCKVAEERGALWKRERLMKQQLNFSFKLNLKMYFTGAVL